MTARDGKPCKQCGTSEWHASGECKVCGRAKRRRWEKKNPEKVRERRQRWEKKNPEKMREKWRRREEKHPEKMREKKRRWRENNPEKAQEAVHRRRARIAGNGGSYTPAEWKEVVRQQDGRCLACGKKAKLTVDHVLPLSMGGTNDISNIQGLCYSCNSRKCDRHIDYRPGGKGIRRWVQRKLFDE